MYRECSQAPAPAVCLVSAAKCLIEILLCSLRAFLLWLECWVSFKIWAHFLLSGFLAYLNWLSWWANIKNTSDNFRAAVSSDAMVKCSMRGTWITWYFIFPKRQKSSNLECDDMYQYLVPEFTSHQQGVVCQNKHPEDLVSANMRSEVPARLRPMNEGNAVIQGAKLQHYWLPYNFSAWLQIRTGE